MSFLLKMKNLICSMVSSDDELLPVPSGSSYYEHIPFPEGPGVEKLQKLLRYLPRLDIKNGPWVAGGAPRRILQGKNIDDGDVDIFFKNKMQFKLFEIAMSQFEEVIKTPRATTYLIDGIKVQIIYRKFYLSIEEIFQDFDFSACQIATDGKQLAVTPKAHRDITNSVLSLAPNGKVARSTVIRRMSKYLSYGFIPEQDLFTMLVSSGPGVTSPWAIFEGDEINSNYDAENDAAEGTIDAEDMNAGVLRTIAREMGISNDG